MSNILSLTVGNAATLAAAAAFLLGGVINASGRKAVREEFVRYGFPWWWCRVTALLEILTAILLVLPPTFTIGLVLGTGIMLAAILAVVRARDFGHLPPPAVFLLLLMTAAFFQVSS
ncbi:DoxX family protein [Rhizobium halophytocola]|uniref:Membrane protein YphA (DoxX/SURF4 family) n=1 Tax=Rhizobium halophytocola TaxID=735519 RepID=A0ABS4DVA6_9HYPH|nr:DoxX family protein [Rhizobium halophytocola]MBP1849633.1 putative membrane protein YphA (DoxX/SURF4 family) [Rhizobium halophytocola]